MPSTQWIRPLTLALVVVFAGCSVPFAAQPNESPPAMKSPAGTPHAELPPGVVETGLENASALLTAHRTSLRTTGYRLEERSGGSRTTYVVTANYSAYRIVPGPTASKPAVWANESMTLARLTRDGHTVYRQPPRQWASPRQLTRTETLHLLFTASDYAVDGTRPCDTRRCTVLTAAGSPRFQNFTARALVRPTGVVTQFRATYTRSNRTGASEYELVLTQRGNVTVARPPWVETAIKRS